MKPTQVTEKLDLMIPAEILAIEVFRQIAQRPKPKGRTDSEHLIIATKELNYIYHTCNPNSSYWNYPEETRDDKLGKDLFEGIIDNWKPDTLIKKAIDWYSKHILTPSMHTVAGMLEALHECEEIVRAVIKHLKQNLKDKKYESGLNNKKGNIVSGAELMLNDLTALLKVSKEIPAHIDVLEKVYDKLRSEQSKSTSRVKGGVFISERER